MRSDKNAKVATGSLPVDQTALQPGMVIDRDVPTPMDDGVALRAGVFRPVAEKPAPVILSRGPYAKGLAFQEGASDGLAANGRCLPRGRE